MTRKSIATASINRESATALIAAALGAAKDIGIPAAVAIVDLSRLEAGSRKARN